MIDEKGYIKGLIDKRSKVNYYAEGQTAPLLAIRVNKEMEKPYKMIYNKEKKEIKLLFSKNGVEAVIKIEEKATHINFELVSVVPKEIVELIIWGPYPTKIKEIIGETVGVVRNSVYAIGIQALNLKTLGGYPTYENDVEPSYNIFSTGSFIDVMDTVKVLYRGQTARPEQFGSVLQAYCRDRSRDRVIPNWGNDKYFVPAFNDGGVTGSKIALFGCPASIALKILGKIEIEEGLPHPIIDGKWGKISPTSTSSYIITSFGEDNINKAIELTKKAGLKYLYHRSPFETWGHFRLKKESFPDNWESMKRCVEIAKKQGIRLGVHTLSNFITTNDPYVTPVPDERLAKVGFSRLSTDVDERTGEVPIESPIFFNQMKNNTLKSAVVGKEIIQYGKVSEKPPWKLLDCKRGAFGTKASYHKKGDRIGKLMDHPYRTFLTNNELSEEVAIRIAELFNKTGLMQISFDGLEGNWSTGMGQYGKQRFVKIWYDHLKPELKGKVINDASRPEHYFWHIFTRMNWGEPWYAGFRESQTKYRLMNQDYFSRNLIPHMLGWFRMTPGTSLEDMEWLLARSAGFDAGFGLVTDLSITEKNGIINEILSVIKQWEKARLSSAFSEEQKKQMRNVNNEFELKPAGKNVWKLFQFAITRYVHKKTQGFSTLNFYNPYEKQPLQFVLSVDGDFNISNPSFKIDNSREIKIPVVLSTYQKLKYEGGNEVYLYSKNWNLIRRVNIDESELIISKGRHNIMFNCEFQNGKESIVKIELKTKNEGEEVRAKVERN